MEDSLNQAAELLLQISEDRTVPKNIREGASNARKTLTEPNEGLRVRVDRVIQILDELSEDPNIPVYTRTQVWSVVSAIESVIA